MVRKQKVKKQQQQVVVVQGAPKRARSKKKKTPGLSGRGDYYGPFAQLGAYGGARLGGLVDNYVLRGRGDYSLKKNSIMPSTSGVLDFKSNKHSHTISGSEFLANVVSSGTANTFNVQSIPLSVDNPAFAPQLRQLAANYSEFELLGLVVEYRPLSADALSSTNITLGRVILATNYNPYAPNFTSAREMEAYEFSTAGKPSIGMLHPIECAPSETSIEVLQTSVSSNANLFPSTNTASNPNYPVVDKRFTSLGNFQFATDRFQGQNVLAGELWLHYHVKLLKPRLWSSIGNSNDYWAAEGSSASLSGSTPWSVLTTQSGLCKVGYSGGFTVTPNGTSLTFQNPDGSNMTNANFLISGYFASGTGVPAPGTLGATGGYGVAPLTGNGFTWNSNTLSVTGYMGTTWYVSITGDGTLTWTGVTFPTGTVNYFVIVQRLPADFWRAM